MNDFDSIAPYYDRVAKLVFGNSINACQKTFLTEIPANSRILILGGGTGWIVQEILKVAKKPNIIYVEKSEKMIEIVKSKLSEDDLSQMQFVHQPFEKFSTDSKFDVIISNFFLDVFPKEELQTTIDSIKSILKPKGILLVSDFQINDSRLYKLWQKPLLWVMHVFFGYTSQLGSRSLQNINRKILQSGFKVEKEQEYFAKMIFSKVFKKQKKLS